MTPSVDTDVDTDTVAALYAQVATRRWSSIIAHAWLHLFGVPASMRIVTHSGPRAWAGPG